MVAASFTSGAVFWRITWRSRTIKPGALSILQKYGFQSCLLNRDEPLATVLAALPDWQKVYEDETSILFVRRSASSALGAQISSAAPDSGRGL